MESSDKIRVDRYDDDAGETSVRPAQSARELERHLPGRPPYDRLADEQLVNGWIELLQEMLAIAEIERRPAIICRGSHLIAIGADQGELKCLIADQRGSRRPGTQIEVDRIVLETLAKEKQRSIDALQDVDDILFEQPDQS